LRTYKKTVTIYFPLPYHTISFCINDLPLTFTNQCFKAYRSLLYEKGLLA